MDNLLKLNKDLETKNYKHSGYSSFKISDPKPRDIHKAIVRDRLIHHAIYRILYTYFDKTKTHISIITHVKDSVIVINIKNNTKGDEISWIVINGSGNNTTINNHFKASLFKFSKHKTISTDIENIRTNSKDIDFTEIEKNY